MVRNKKRMGVDVFPTIEELKRAKKRDLTPEEYCAVHDDIAEYERQIREERAAAGLTKDDED